MKEIKSMTTHYQCDFCEFSHVDKYWIKNHEKQAHTCPHDNFMVELHASKSEDDNEISLFKRCKDCNKQIDGMAKDLLFLSEEDKLKIWEIFLKYKT